MRALTWQGKPTDAVVRVTSTAICGSDLHLYEVLGPYLEPGDVLGHEPMGVVEEVGADVTHLKPGRMGQCHVKRWADDIRPVVTADGDPLGLESFATHRLPLSQAPQAYEMFQKKEDGCCKVVLNP